MAAITRFALVRPPHTVRVTNADEAAVALRRLLKTSKYTGSTAERKMIVEAVIDWIAAREQEVDDIKYGAARLLLQAAEENERVRTGSWG